MKVRKVNYFYLGGFCLLGLAVYSIGLAVVFPLDRRTETPLLFFGMVLFILGAIILTVLRDDRIDRNMVSMTLLQSMMTLESLYAQGIPNEGDRFVATPEGFFGIQRTPTKKNPVAPANQYHSTYRPLIQMINDAYGFRMPNDERKLVSALRVVSTELLGIATMVEGEVIGDNVIIYLRGYIPAALYQDVAQRIDKTMERSSFFVGMPVAGLLACLASQGTGRTCIVRQVDVNVKTQILRLSLYLE
jgi:hypothetical protein